jgi:TPP-dependent pyruvate/acetoin dehydrogenase alpha subunit
MMHTTADDPLRYRDEAEVKQWEKRDPLLRFTKHLETKGRFSTWKRRSGG